VVWPADSSCTKQLSMTAAAFAAIIPGYIAALLLTARRSPRNTQQSSRGRRFDFLWRQFTGGGPDLIHPSEFHGIPSSW